jgi:hypothetical protein
LAYGSAERPRARRLTTFIDGRVLDDECASEWSPKPFEAKSDALMEKPSWPYATPSTAGAATVAAAKCRSDLGAALRAEQATQPATPAVKEYSLVRIGDAEDGAGLARRESVDVAK